MKTAGLLLAPMLLLTSGAQAQPLRSPRDLVYARLGESVRLGGVRVTPLRVLEDSRCPTDASCVWAGRVRIAVRIGSSAHELTLGQPLPMLGGVLQLTNVLPARKRDRTIAPRAYRFGFRFDRTGGMRLIKN
jgi:hypothetical protein